MSTDYVIPKTQIAAVIEKAGGDLQIKKDHPVRRPEELAPGECLVKLDCSGACHSDLHAVLGDWPVPPRLPLVGGHEGVGIVVAIGKNTGRSPVKLGDRVGIKWIANSCLNCEQCRKGKEQNCPQSLCSGYTIDGTFQEYVVSYVNYVTPIPEGFPSDAAASILCAGVTVYRAIKNSQTNPGDWIVIPGAGGGLGHLAVQYARVRGLRVIAIDTGAEKQSLCLKLGAERWIDFKESKDIVREVQDATDGLGAHAALVTASTSKGYEQAIEYLRPGGFLMCNGLPGAATLTASIFFTVFKSITICGSYVGNRQDAVEAIDIAARGLVKVHFVNRPLDDLKDVYDGLMNHTIAGRVIVDMPKAVNA
ncbi:mannitol-1-phosphate dehydrogenase MPDH1 [Lentinula aciculospora]|uniref:alcohol dehydrogenase n=1 Tax=Lentinula aciculospora TaxID=153920 RepID=A0A9W9DUD4_9AGAR|nr:mannitol-1-phosphate dehydrogenase MPDH1 [Lentinula aciculospora]